MGLEIQTNHVQKLEVKQLPVQAFLFDLNLKQYNNSLANWKKS
jgi:hypothetical protein